MCGAGQWFLLTEAETTVPRFKSVAIKFTVRQCLLCILCSTACTTTVWVPKQQLQKLDGYEASKREYETGSRTRVAFVAPSGFTPTGIALAPPSRCDRPAEGIIATPGFSRACEFDGLTNWGGAVIHDAPYSLRNKFVRSDTFLAASNGGRVMFTSKRKLVLVLDPGNETISGRFKRISLSDTALIATPTDPGNNSLAVPLTRIKAVAVTRPSFVKTAVLGFGIVAASVVLCLAAQ